LEAAMDKIETINFHEEKEVNGIKFWCYNAGHVLGAAMFMIGKLIHTLIIALFLSRQFLECNIRS
jgi:Cft2 family RNA processing exonuclease